MVKVHIGSMKWDDAQVKAAVDAWLAENPPIYDATPLLPYISQAVTDYITANPPADGADATDAQVAAAVDAWFDINSTLIESLTSGIVNPWLQEHASSENIQGFVDAWLVQNPPADGQNATDAQVEEAVNAWLTLNPPADGANATQGMVDLAVDSWLTENPPAPGDPGPANSLSIGTVSSGTTASATITGEAPSQQLNLVLPKGADGVNVTQQDTGLRDVTSLLTIGGGLTSVGSVFVRRIGNIVAIEMRDFKCTSADNSVSLNLPTGFSAVFFDPRPTSGGGFGLVFKNGTLRYNRAIGNGSTANFAGGTYLTADPWPTSLPGSAA